MKININLNMAREINYSFPSLITKTIGIKRGIALLRWRVPDIIADEKQIGIRIDGIRNELDSLTDEMQRLYEKINMCIDGYVEAEQRNDNNSSQFK